MEREFKAEKRRTRCQDAQLICAATSTSSSAVPQATTSSAFREMAADEKEVGTVVVAGKANGGRMLAILLARTKADPTAARGNCAIGFALRPLRWAWGRSRPSRPATRPGTRRSSSRGTSSRAGTRQRLKGRPEGRCAGLQALRATWTHAHEPHPGNREGRVTY